MIVRTSSYKRVPPNHVITVAMRYRDGLVGCATPDYKYLVTSPNVDWIPRLAYGIVSVSLMHDARFGIHDPIIWPQIFVENSRYAWLCAIMRKPTDIRDPCMPMWLNLSPANFVPIRDCIVTSLGTLDSHTTDTLRPLVEAMQLRSKTLEEHRGRQPELYYIVTAMREAFDRLDYPSTFRDLLFQFSCVQRYWLLGSAWLEFHVHIWRSVSFPEDRPAPPSIRTDLMGAITTNPSVVQKLSSVGIPVWFMRLMDTATEQDIVLANVLLTEPKDIAVDSGLFSGTAIYTGPVGERHLQAIARKCNFYADVEGVPMPTVLDVPIPAVESSTSSASIVNAPASLVVRPTQPQRGRARQSPCKSIGLIEDFFF